ncbi:hypothetical protein P280DRAFT_548221 [Massarina eburnea CBS 473.64]|uniref:Uncharacterized protein n=1 Tax=Massarina eburnea CBS 473.64 TaxID=1395130 RepID=A0A6A6S598_9PLEO|nr:hypothetical protein P280DRAFT_548221 [Massarina eburnea CBS 473.64]
MQRSTTGQMLTFELIRVSSTPDIAPNAPQVFQWSTRRGKDLSLVFDTFRSGKQPSEVLRITQGYQILYDVPLQDFIEKGKRISATLRQHGAEVVGDQLPCSGIAKSPLIGLRYVVPVSGLVRRFQMTFSSSEDYDQAFNHLSQLGLHFSPVKPKASLTRGSSASSQDQAGSISSRFSELANRPFTADNSRPSSLGTQLQEASVARPLSAQPLFSSPLKEHMSLRRPDSAVTTLSVDEFDQYRPLSATRSENSITCARPSTSELPPRRELPFQRTDSPPLSRGSDSGRPTSRSNFNMGPPPPPTYVRPGSGRPNSRATNSPTTELPPLRMPTIVENSLQKKAPVRRGSNAPHQMNAVPVGKENPSFASPPVSRSSTSFGRGSNRPLGAMSDAGQNERSYEAYNPYPTPLNSDTVNSNESRSDDINDTIQGDDSLSKYAMQRDEERKSALNQRMLQYLEDPNFLTLVGDVEISFARIAPRF